MKNLTSLIGREQPLDKVCIELKNLAIDLAPSIVGAQHVTCSDETERECLDMFSDVFVKPLLPTLKLAQQAAFRTANLGASYEWGSVRIAEHHFATGETERSYKLIVVKINAHTSKDMTPTGPRYGRLDRYNEQSDCCGALFALMRGDTLPSIEKIREVFEWEDMDRVGALRDPERVPEENRGLVAAILQARLQARVAMADIMDHTPRTPTLYLVLPCVTVNIPELDKELLCGVYRADFRTPERSCTYVGLGDDPDRFEIKHDGDRLEVSAPEIGEVRPCRDHRQVPLSHWLEHGFVEPALEEGWALEGDAEAAKKLTSIFDRAPVEGALRLFSEGLVPIHYVFSADRIARDPEAVDEATLFYDELLWTLDDRSEDDLAQLTATLDRIRNDIKRKSVND